MQEVSTLDRWTDLPILVVGTLNTLKMYLLP